MAIDSRKGNQNIKKLYTFAQTKGFKIVADVMDLEDVKNIIQYKPDYIATTFSFMNMKGMAAIPDIDLIREIKKLTDIPVIAEGAISMAHLAQAAKKAGADNICIGRAISNVMELTKDFSESIEAVQCS